MEQSELHIDTIYNNALRILSERAPGYRIRNAEPRDISRVVYINRTCLPENYPVYFFEELLRNYGKAFYVAESPEGEVVGYVMTRVEWKPGFFKKLLARSLHIVSLAVLPEYRRKGLGYALMAHAMRAGYREYSCNETYLEVRVSNRPAISLYEKLGYRIVRIAHGYYLDGEDAYIMARRLP